VVRLYGVACTAVTTVTIVLVRVTLRLVVMVGRRDVERLGMVTTGGVENVIVGNKGVVLEVDVRLPWRLAISRLSSASTRSPRAGLVAVGFVVRTVCVQLRFCVTTVELA
jgi:hypothetical protein